MVIKKIEKFTYATSSCTSKLSRGAQLTDNCKVLGTVDILINKNLMGGGVCYGTDI